MGALRAREPAEGYSTPHPAQHTPSVQRRGSFGSTTRLSSAGIWALYCSTEGGKQEVLEPGQVHSAQHLQLPPGVHQTRCLDAARRTSMMIIRGRYRLSIACQMW